MPDGPDASMQRVTPSRIRAMHANTLVWQYCPMSSSVRRNTPRDRRVRRARTQRAIVAETVIGRTLSAVFGIAPMVESMVVWTVLGSHESLRTWNSLNSHSAVSCGK